MFYQEKNQNHSHLNCNSFSKIALFQNNRFIFEQDKQETPPPKSENPKPPEPTPSSNPLPPQVAQNLEENQQQRVKLAKDVSATQPNQSSSEATTNQLNQSSPESTSTQPNPTPSESTPSPKQPSQSSESGPQAPSNAQPTSSTEQQTSKNFLEELKKLPLIGPLIADVWDSFEKMGLMDLLRQIPPLTGFIPPKPGTTPNTQSTSSPETPTKSPEPLPPSHSAKVQSLISKYTEAFKNTKISAGQLNLNLDNTYNPAERQATKAICDIMGIKPVQSAEELLLGTINAGGKLIDNPDDTSLLQLGDLVFFKQESQNNEFQLVNIGIISSLTPEPQIKILLPNQAKVSTQPLSTYKAAIFGFVQPKK